MVVGTCSRAVVVYEWGPDGWRVAWRRIMPHSVVGVAVLDLDKVGMCARACVAVCALCVPCVCVCACACVSV